MPLMAIAPLTVSASNASLGLSASPSTSTSVNASVTFTAQLAGVAFTPGLPSGQVNFTALGSTITGCNAVPVDATGKATCTTAALPVGSDAIAATYSGDSNFVVSAPGALTQSVTALVATLGLTPSPVSPTAVNTTVTFTAQLGGVALSPTVPVGTVTFTINGNPNPNCAPRQVNASGAATCIISTLSAGAYTVRATYSGDTNFLVATPGSTLQNVTSLAATLGVTASPSSSTSLNAPVTFTARLAGISLTPVTPSGIVTFTVNGAPNLNCPPTQVDAGGKAACATSLLSAGADTIAASYSGDTNFTVAAAGQVIQSVSPAAASVVLSPSPSGTTSYGQSVTLTATVTPTGLPVPLSGLLRFTDNANPIAGCAAVPVNPGTGVATCVTSLLSAGANTIMATYGGDANYTSASDSRSHQVLSPSFVVSVTSDDAIGLPANCSVGGGDSNCSLRDALAAATITGGANITFDSTLFSVSQTIKLGSGGTIAIPTNTTITGTTSGSAAMPANLITVNGQDAYGVFTVPPGATGVVIANLVITKGNNTTGGAGINNQGTLTVSYSTISYSNTRGNGGGINNTGTLEVDNTTFNGNGCTSLCNGGALYNAVGGTLTINASTFSNNSSWNGAGIANAGNMTATQSTFYGGFANNNGGGIFNPGNATVHNSTITGNLSNEVSGDSNSIGGGIVNPGSLILDNSIVLKNIGIGPNRDITGNSFYGGADNLLNTSNNSNIDPMLAPLGNYGGPTQTMVPLPGSPAICAAYITVFMLPTDQRGNPRTTTYGSKQCYDIGAVQSSYALSFSTAPSTVVQNVAMSPAPAITLNESGTVFADKTDTITIPLSLTTGSGILTGGSAATSATTGIATYSGLSISLPGAGDVLTANLTLNSSQSPATAISLASTAFNVNSAVTQLAFVTAPASVVTAGGNAGAAVTVNEEDLSGTLAPSASDTITLTVTGPQSYSHVYTAAAANGVASFNLTTPALTAAGAYTYTASIAGNPSVTTAASPENVSAAAAALYTAISGSNQSAVIGMAFTTPLKMLVTDQYGNPVQGASVSYTVPSSGAGATFTGMPLTTAVDGTASSLATANGTASTTAYKVTINVAGLVAGGKLNGPQPNTSGQSFFQLTNTPQSTTLTVTPLPASSVYGQPVTVTAAISPASVLTSSPTGTVTFYDGAIGLTPASTVSIAAASFTVSVPAVGNHTYAAQYGGDTNFSSSSLTSATSALQVAKASATLSGPVTPASFTYGVGGTVVVSIAGQFAGTGITPPSGSLSYDTGDGSGSHAASISSGSATLQISATQGAGTYSLTVGFSGDTNYGAASSITLPLKIAQATAIISVTPYTVTYDANAHTATGTAKGVGNVDLSSSLTLSGTTHTVAGAYPSDAWSFHDATGNYADTSGTASDSIGKATAIISVTPYTVTYDSNAHTATGTAKGVGNVDLSSSLTLSGTTHTAAGTYSSDAWSFHDATGNYADASGTASDSIGKATPPITWVTPSAITYGTALSATQLNASSTVAGSFTYTPSPGAVLAAGPQTLSVTLTPTDSNDYTSPGKTVALTVNLASLTVVANSATKVYGTANPAFTGSVTGQQNGDTFTESFFTSALLSSPVAAYTIVPSVVGANLPDYTESVTNGTLTVTQAGTTTALRLSSGSITPGQSVTLTATVASLTSGAPTGTVNFYDNGNLLNTAAITTGTASYSTAALAPGLTHTITAIYSGDINFLTSSNTSNTTVVVAPLDFTMTIAGPSNQTVVPGSTISYQVTVTPMYGSYAGTVNFAISGLPPGATVSFSPSTISANGGPQTITVTIKTAPATIAMQHAPPAGPSTASRIAPIALAFLLLFGVGSMRRHGRNLRRMLCVALLLLGGAVTAMISGCGATNGFFTQVPQNYTVTITATAGNLQHTTIININLQ